MRPLSSDAFLQEMSRIGIGVDAAYAANWPRNLAFNDGGHESVSWSCENDTGLLVRLLCDVLDELCGHGGAYLWPKSPNWLEELVRIHPVAGVWCHHLLTLNAGDGAIEFGRSDRLILVSAMTCSVVFGWSWPTDLYVVPTTGKEIVHIGHHEDVCITHATEASRAHFTRHMEMKNWRLVEDE